MKKLFSFGLAVCILLALAACSSQEIQVLSVWNRRCGLHLQAEDIVSFRETHIGFPADGDTLVVVQCEESFPESALPTKSGWRPLPLSASLYAFFTQSYQAPIPIDEITEGYYFFWDRHAECTDPLDDTPVFDRYSLNFSIAIYDRATKLLYLFDCDT